MKQQYGQPEEDYRNFLGELTRMFAEMNAGLAVKTFEANQHNPTVWITTFLSKFDAIFTLNQDTLLESHYIPGAAKAYHTPCYRPGYVEMPETFSAGGQRSRLYTPNTSLDLVPNSQPYFKLHGSSDLMVDRSMTMIMGTNKSQAIDREPILKWYRSQFIEHLSKPHTRLMIIGYSFADHHINEIIVGAVKNGLQIFVIDLAGVIVMDRRPEGLSGGYDVFNDLKGAVIGASQRPVLSTFSGADPAEFGKVMRFFNPSQGELTDIMRADT
jgi:hypothetical protein